MQIPFGWACGGHIHKVGIRMDNTSPYVFMAFYIAIVDFRHKNAMEVEFRRLVPQDTIGNGWDIIWVRTPDADRTSSRVSNGGTVRNLGPRRTAKNSAAPGGRISSNDTVNDIG